MKTINHAAEESLDYADILSRFSYAPLTGEIRFKTKPACKRLMAGDVAGTVSAKGYRKIQIDGRIFAAHRLAWFMTYAVWPESLIDHENGKRDDNRLQNLRNCTNGQNKVHSVLNRNNTSGAAGVKQVTFKSGNTKWKASLGKMHLGYFETFEQALTARLSAEKMNHAGFGSRR